MEDGNSITAFSLIGGPLYKLRLRFGLVRNGSNSIRLGLALGLGTLLILLLLSLVAGTLPRIFSMGILAGIWRLSHKKGRRKLHRYQYFLHLGLPAAVPFLRSTLALAPFTLVLFSIPGTKDESTVYANTF